MSSQSRKYLSELIQECDDMLHLLLNDEGAVVSNERKSNIIMQINSTKEYLILLREKANHCE